MYIYIYYKHTLYIFICVNFAENLHTKGKLFSYIKHYTPKEGGLHIIALNLIRQSQ